MPRQPNLSEAARALGRKGGRIGGRARGPTKSRVASPRFRPLTDEARAKGLHVRRVKAAAGRLAACGMRHEFAAEYRKLSDLWGEDVAREALGRVGRQDAREE